MKRLMMPKQMLIAAAVVGLALRVADAGEPAAVSMDLDATPLAEALNRLQEASGLRLAFSTDVIKDAQPVTLSAKDEPVDSVLLR
ncbi:MAG TPA: hypothetical protein VM223_04130, partial [Planctomycetota bacterium]|nr:hypothetical protein [Planctomycetota bacterium]